ncbi:hypothetical protein L207DRAFT_267928 [Hyaloscypha variabilis F]|uniref:Uncharacterized protein n=1 Tax=Hyaloscypha variabilis (strain UAMH 11265 / GT02V1 / F) TaxID=1149755 RepID=A0A2J6RZL9_HYAVF|nr:hypothetical protein L207DRAFT_267928 [Hyaloscypha variabilis F]
MIACRRVWELLRSRFPCRPNSKQMRQHVTCLEPHELPPWIGSLQFQGSTANKSCLVSEGWNQADTSLLPRHPRLNMLKHLFFALSWEIHQCIITPRQCYIALIAVFILHGLSLSYQTQFAMMERVYA